MVKCPYCGMEVSPEAYVDHVSVHQGQGGASWRASTQVDDLKRIFERLNPGIGTHVVDWGAHVRADFTLPENRLELSMAYPQYRWFDDEGGPSRDRSPPEHPEEAPSLQALSKSLAAALRGSNLTRTEMRLVSSEFWHALNRRGWVRNDEVENWIEDTRSLL